MYGVKYKIEFSTLKRNEVRVELLKSNYQGEVIQLQGMTSPFVLDTDDEDFLYIPIRKSTCKINIYGNDYLRDIFSTNYQDWKILTYYKDKLIWSGFIKPETYTQDYSSEKFELNIEGVSALSVLENIEYKSDVDGYITFTDLIKNIVSVSRASWNNIYIPNVYSSTKESIDNNILDELKINTANFFDEDGTPMKYYEVLEEMCKFLNWTASDWNGSLYFIDVDYTGAYRKYNNQFVHYDYVEQKNLNIQDIGFNGGDQALDMIGGYSKASVRSSNYKISDIVGKLDYDELDILAHEKSNYDLYTTDWQILSSPVDSQWKVHHYDFKQNEITEEEWLKYKSHKGLINTLTSAFANAFNYQSEGRGHNKTAYQYSKCIFVRTKSKENYTNSENNTPLYELKDKPVLTIYNPRVIKYSAGVISINFSVEALTYYSKPWWPNAIISNKTNGISHIKATLRIGKYYWNGKIMTDKVSTFNIPLNNDNDNSPMNIITNKTLFFGPNDATGHIINIFARPNNKLDLTGDFEFIMYSSNEYFNRKDIAGFNLHGTNISFVPYTENVGKDNDDDRLYENIVNGDFINELDTITFNINSYNRDGLSFSKPLLNNSYLQTMYNVLLNDQCRPEELLIKRIINQYQQPKIKLTQQLNLNNITNLNPTINFTDKYTHGLFQLTAANIDFALELAELKMIKNERG